jgi:hypothetical protein
MYVLETAPGKALEPERHLYEEIIYVLKGHGATEVWQGAETKRSFEWGEASLFSLPLNVWHRSRRHLCEIRHGISFPRHFNTGKEPARHIAFRTGGGTMIGYEDEDPQIRHEFEAALASAGVPSRMPSAGAPFSGTSPSGRQ